MGIATIWDRDTINLLLAVRDLLSVLPTSEESDVWRHDTICVSKANLQAVLMICVLTIVNV